MQGELKCEGKEIKEFFQPNVPPRINYNTLRYLFLLSWLYKNKYTHSHFKWEHLVWIIWPIALVSIPHFLFKSSPSISTSHQLSTKHFVIYFILICTAKVVLQYQGTFRVDQWSLGSHRNVLRICEEAPSPKEILISLVWLLSWAWDFWFPRWLSCGEWNFDMFEK